jgi:hypothetical protein
MMTLKPPRPYELPAAPRLQPGICELCAAAIVDRRTLAGEAVAA